MNWNGQSFSSAWVAIAGSGGVNEIFQIGLLKCQSTGCASATQFVWAYGRQATACGVALAPSAHVIGSSGTSNHRYTITKSSTQYAAQIDGVEKKVESISAIETCWINGSRHAEFEDEVADHNDQSGGQISSGFQQHWTGAKYQDTSGLAWHAMNEPLNVGCTINQLTTQKCQMSPVSHDAFRTWDNRFP